MGIKYINNAESTLDGGIGAAATTLDVASGEGIKFPTIVSGSGDYFYATLVDIEGHREVIKVTEHQVSTDTFQVIERAKDAIGVWGETPTAYAFDAGDKVQCRLPAVAIMAPDGTTSDTFQIDTDDTGITLKHDTQELKIRNLGDSAYANLYAADLTLSGALALAGNITGALALTMSGALSGVTTLAMAGALSGVTSLAMGGALTGATNITASDTVTAADFIATDDITCHDDLTVNGKITATAESSAIDIDNEAADVAIVARDHSTPADPEVVNVVYGTTTPPAASTVPQGTIWLKYVP